MSLTIVNRGNRDDSLTDLTSPDGTVDLTGTRDLPAGHGGAVRCHDRAVRDDQRPDEAARTRPSPCGSTFARTDPITLDTVVLPATGPYASITPGPVTPAVEPTDTPTLEVIDTASPSPT